MSTAASTLIAVDIGNSRIKLGRFQRGGSPADAGELPEPCATCDLAISDRSGQFDIDRLANWSGESVDGNSFWWVASVHRGAAERFIAAVAILAARVNAHWPLRRIAYSDLPMTIRVEAPERVGVDRLLAALAADRLRRRDRAAIVVDLGSAMTVDLVSDDGAFEGGAILPGISMSARALAEQTDALPCVGVDRLDRPPDALGKSTVAAIEAGLYWGAVGAIRELITRYSAGRRAVPDVFLTGGASAHVAELLAPNTGDADKQSTAGGRVCHLPHLVLAGIALVDQRSASDS
jgi:type III pantothenate kinase